MKKISIKEIVETMHLEVLAGHEGLSRDVIHDDIHRPGIEFTGFLEHFPMERIQILGRQEITYLHSLSHVERDSRIGAVVAKHPPCFIITRGQEDLTYFEKHCTKEQVPLLRTPEKTTKFLSKLNNFLEKALAKEIGIHGVCLNVFGVGILLRGESGIGKSEAALALVERGHRLVSDDLVILKQIDPVTLLGTHNQSNRDFLSLRGIGLVDIPRLYGSGSFQQETQVNLDILLSPWKEKHHYDALGVEQNVVTYLDVTIRHIEIPVRPGRDIAGLIEVAAKNWRLQQQGYNALKAFEDRLRIAKE
ncbi:HPr(Ser) kinase/phosphatase [Ammoniphilus sp. CFH 90114]|uniref:HPr(Ser) kinase/phosphatase n=1 Tax=Ammoniphilus sp. CFH 90114 TaxID=2493665 RepID=UPI00100F1E90|nr:HPr(Ser) kinase/phosphatase [Ammoniphilus sp. CFH 90114]RXT13629.1 HPr(Ser) kinase/phosphatase [Ammoniphilus sp. CFH 90114]